MSTSYIADTFRSHWLLFVLVGVLLLVAGAVAIVVPAISSIEPNELLALVLAFVGIVQIVQSGKMRGDFLFAWQMWSHKVLRYLVFIPMLALIVTNVLLLDTAPIYQIAAVGQVLLYLLAAAGVLFNSASLPGVVALASYLVLVNVASLLAFARFVARKKQVLWKPRTG